MKQVIKKQTLHQLLFIACVTVPYFNVYEATFAIWTFTAIISVKRKYSFTILHYVACFMAIFGIALIVSFFKDVKLYNFLRDITYLIKPVMGLFIGYQLCKDYTRFPFRIILNTGIILAFVHLLLVVYSIGILHIKDIHKLREVSGYFSDFEVYAIIILLFHKKLGLDISRQKMIILFMVLGLSTIFYLSRTNFIQFGILYIALKGYFVINTRSIAVISAIILFIGAGYAAIYYYNPARNGKGFEAFLYKLKNAPIEPFKTNVRRDNWKDFHDNYRSYENISTINQLTKKGPATVIFGEGMGSSVDLKRKVWLQTSSMRFIPFLHNGFMTIFLKSGLLGNIILIYSIYLLFKYKKSDDNLIQNINYLLLGTGVFLIISYWVFMGLYFVADTKSIIIGYLISYREALTRKQRIDSAIVNRE